MIWLQYWRLSKVKTVQDTGHWSLTKGKTLKIVLVPCYRPDRVGWTKRLQTCFLHQNVSSLPSASHTQISQPTSRSPQQNCLPRIRQKSEIVNKKLWQDIDTVKDCQYLPSTAAIVFAVRRHWDQHSKSQTLVLSVARYWYTNYLIVQLLKNFCSLCH